MRVLQFFLAFVVPSGECGRKTCGWKKALFSVPTDGNLATCRLFSVRTENSLHVAKFPSVGTENSAIFRPQAFLPHSPDGTTNAKNYKTII